MIYAWDYLAMRLYTVYDWIGSGGLITHVQLVYGARPVHDFTYFHVNLN